MKLISKTLVFKNPPKVTTAYEYEYYSRPKGVDKVRLRFMDISDDIFDDGSLTFSTDNGRTWKDQRAHNLGKKTADATLRRFDGVGWVDPVEGKMITLYLEGLFRKDNLLEGVRSYYVCYRTSEDGGRTNLVDERIIQNGPGYSAEKPFDGVHIGKNAMMMPLIPGIVRLPSGVLCLVLSRSILGPDGEYHNPGGGFTWLEEMVLHGRWQKGGKIAWEQVGKLSIDPSKSTRGLDEMTMQLLDDGRLFLVMRGSNDGEGKIPGYKWFATSKDEGRTWSEVKPWGYSDGSLFYSSASCCQLLKHSNGKMYWIGNIANEMPRANQPRHTLHIGEVDPKTLGLKKETIFVIDQAKNEEGTLTQLSNFYAHEDRESHHLVLHMPYFVQRDGVWTGDTFRYLISVD